MELKYHLLLIVFANIEINVTGSLESDRRMKYETNSPYLNVCNVEDRASIINCYCESRWVNTATKADCWVFNGGIAEDDPFWSNFLSQPKIERLGFTVRADGYLNYIPAKVIVRLDRLWFLHIQYAELYKIPPYAFANSTTLREIHLRESQVTKLEEMAFAHIPMLTNVSLTENYITEIKPTVFYDLPNLHRMYLSNNSISVLHDGCFSHLHNLKKLDLNTNLLTVVTRENFLGLSSLYYLDMRNNKLAMIGHLAFAELPSLQELYLDRNEIQFVSERGFGRLSQLRKLSLANNKLERLDDEVFDEVPKLYYLDLRNNLLDTVRPEIMKSIMSNMMSYHAVMRLDGNKLVCDCNLSWMRTLCNETKSRRLQSALHKLYCIMDSKVNTQSEDITIKRGNSEISISYIPDDDIDGAFDEDSAYDEWTENQEPESVGVKVEYRRKLLEIPAEMMPCSRVTSEEAESRLPQDEAVLYNGSAETSSSMELFLMVALVVTSASVT